MESFPYIAASTGGEDHYSMKSTCFDAEWNAQIEVYAFSARGVASTPERLAI
jgi:hypothetical protein